MTKKDRAKQKRKADKEKKRQAKEASLGTGHGETGGSSWAEKQEAAQAERRGKKTKVVMFPK